MAQILLSAFLTCVASLFVGQAALRLSGAREWTWIAPSVGMSILMLIAVPQNHLPGRTATDAVILALLTIVSIVWCASDRAHLPPWKGTLAALPVAFLVLVPFLTAGRPGILGMSVDNDMGSHMQFVEIYLSRVAEHVKPMRVDYPLGPHAVVAVISEGLGIRVDRSFAGWTMALPMLSAWTAVALARRSSWIKQVLAATVVGLPFLMAAYYGEGSFKEVLQAVLVLAFVLVLAGYGPKLERGRWVPLAFLVGGIASVYSVTGFPWPAAILGLWVAGTLVRTAVRGDLRTIPAAVRRELPAIGIGIAVLVVELLPQAHRLYEFWKINLGNGSIITPKENLGNLAGPLPGWEGFGVWNNPDFRFPNPSHWGDVWIAMMVALAVFGAFWAFRRGRWLLPLAAGASVVIWALSIPSQSPYVVAKGLVITSPLLVMLVVFPFVDDGDGRPESLRTFLGRIRARPLTVGIATLLGLLVFFRVGIADLQSVRSSMVGPTAHVEELRTFQPRIEGKKVLYIGGNDFIEYELARTAVRPALLAAGEYVPFSPEKPLTPSTTLDWDSFDAATLNEYAYAITTRDAGASAPPPEFHLVATTPEYQLWKRVGKVGERSILAGETNGVSGALLECDTPEGRKIVRGGGVAAVRTQPLMLQPPIVGAGTSAPMAVELPAGSWELDLPYISPRKVEVEDGSFHATLPAVLDPLGQRWPLGRFESDGQPSTMTFSVSKNALTPASSAAVLGPITATPAGSRDHVVPVAEACGRYVDWYRSAGSSGSRGDR